ncbi:sorbitol operon activator [Streptococcus varani]|jgi:DNA-binding transcriptional regulator of glucitol operon|uniref:Sorbitol operon activator n=1 Tax=Streptococcus varani TaxID=1608583 RepID=A0A0E3WEG9_9STRE|nr:transcriptional regulator GutM [Streptococcus varani]CQR23656.1 sorbitol operon activator [Streptococcus varani]
MNFIIVFAIVCLAAYTLQIMLGLKQLKNFNMTYGQLRRIGRVAIGRRSGKIKSGTIVMFALDKDGKVLAAQKMQGVTVLAKFREMPDYLGQDIHYFDHYNPLVRKENKLLQIAIEDAREVFLRVEAGVYKDVPKYTPVVDVTMQIKMLVTRLKFQFKKQ